MNTIDLETLRYPIGTFQSKTSFSAEEIDQFIQDIGQLPNLLKEAVINFSEKELNTPYRPGGWTVRQTVHHVADSHINSYTRFRLALTEDKPLIKAYEEHLWAELPDGKNAPVEVSLTLLEALHYRWVFLLRALTPEQWQKSFMHPVSGEIKLSHAVGMYSWHGQHHLAHITGLINRNFDQ